MPYQILNLRSSPLSCPSKAPKFHTIPTKALRRCSVHKSEDSDDIPHLHTADQPPKNGPRLSSENPSAFTPLLALCQEGLADCPTARKAETESHLYWTEARQRRFVKKSRTSPTPRNPIPGPREQRASMYFCFHFRKKAEIWEGMIGERLFRKGRNPWIVCPSFCFRKTWRASQENSHLRGDREFAAFTKRKAREPGTSSNY